MPDEVTLHFPSAGLDVSRAFGRQPNRPAYGDRYARTTPAAVNVRAVEPGQGRHRGGSRPGLVKAFPLPLDAGWVVQHLNVLVTAGVAAPGGADVQGSQSGRVVLLVAVSQGEVYTTVPGGTAWTAATNSTGETPALNFTGLVRSAPNIQKLWFVDGTNYVTYSPVTNAVTLWAATAGTLPQDSAGNYARLICTWRGRTVLAGLLLDPQNFFMSKVGDPTDFDYAPASPSAVDAVAGNLSPFGLIGDVVTCLIPYSDDVLIFGCDSHIYLLRGDPLAGGQVDLVSSAVGMAFGSPWCMDPAGAVYFFGQRPGVYRFVPGQVPVRISTAIDPLLRDLNTGAVTPVLVWNDDEQGVDLYLTETAAPAAATHYFYDARAGAWWPVEFGNADFNPLVACTLDGNAADDRVTVIGSWDGYVRAVTRAAADDDGVPIASEVWIGPLLTRTFDDVLLDQLQAVLGETSGAVTATLHVGATAEAALASAGVPVGTLGAGRGKVFAVRRAGHAVYVRLTGTSAWALEAVRVRLAPQGKVRMRGA